MVDERQAQLRLRFSYERSLGKVISAVRSDCRPKCWHLPLLADGCPLFLVISKSNLIAERNGMPHDLPKAYEPGAIEPRWAEYWVHEKLFHVETTARPRPAHLHGDPAAAQRDR